MISLFDLAFVMGPTLAIYAFLAFIHLRFGTLSPILTVLRIIFHLIYTILAYILAVFCYLAYAIVVACWAIVLLNAIQFFTGWPARDKDILPFLRLEETIKAQISAIHKEQRRTVRKIEKLVPRIDRWNEANLILLKDIRSAEVLVKKRMAHYVPHPDRPYFHTSGVQFRVVPTFAEQQAEAKQVPSSSWAWVRWLKNQDEPSVFAARKDARRLGRVHTMHARAFAYLQDEHERLQDKLVEARALNKEALEMPEPVKKPVYRGGFDDRATQQQQQQQRQRHYGYAHQARSGGYEAPLYQQPPVVNEYARRLEEAQKYNGQVMHWCTHCDQRHFWLHQYPNLAAALSVPQFCPCQAAVARHERMYATLGLLAPLPPPTTTTTTTFLQLQQQQHHHHHHHHHHQQEQPQPQPQPQQQQQQPQQQQQQQEQPIYAAAPGPGLAAGHPFPARPNAPAPLPSKAPVAKRPPTFLQIVWNPEAAKEAAAAATTAPASVSPPQPSNGGGRSLLERTSLGADGQPLRATVAAAPEEGGGGDKENAPPRGKSQPRAKRRQGVREENFEEVESEVLGQKGRYRF